MGRDDLQGITIGGQDLAEQLKKDAAREAGETLKETKLYPKKKGSKVRYMDHKEKPGEVKRTSQASLNIINLEANIDRAATNYEKTIALLLTGEEVLATNLREKFGATDGSAILNKLRRSPLGVYFDRTSRKRAFAYTMNSEGCNLTPEQATKIYKNKFKTVTSNTPEDTPEEKVPPVLTEIRLPDIIQKDVQINLTIKLKVEWEV